MKSERVLLNVTGNAGQNTELPLIVHWVPPALGFWLSYEAVTTATSSWRVSQQLLLVTKGTSWL